MSETAGWASLHALFVKRLHERIAIMSELAVRVERGEGEARFTLERQFHSLAGVAGTFDQPGITQLAREGEQRCRRHAPEGIAEIVEDLRKRAAEVPPTASADIATGAAA